ncbi:MG2 domain-containing protein [Flavobacterium sp. PLA-1-15]|uniref:alpha-2-macroglobulin family protein n=1 Tax=Flavobacterium sp. PLA-1-15 TaxID=3380533 RepID=UPI003B793E00
MKNILLLLALLSSFLIFGQDFDKQWKKVYQYELDGKIKSAQEEVQIIYKKAKRKKEEIQIVKCFFYLSKFEQVFDEKAQSTIIENLKKEIKDAKPVSRAVLNHIYGTILQHYYNNNRYEISRRTALEKQKSIDFLTWTTSDFTKETDKAFSESIEDENVLRATFLHSYKDIFEISPYTDGKNHSLYDFLAEKTSAYYRSKIENWTYRNKLASNNLFKILYQNSKVFMELKLDNISDENLKKLLKLLQKNEKYYLEHNPEKADLAYYERIKYIHSVYFDDELYQKNIFELEKKTSSLILKQDLRVERAQLYTYLALKEAEINFHKKALSLIDTVFKSKSNQNAMYRAETLKNEIIRKRLRISFQEKLYPNENIRALINFKNVDSIRITYYLFPVKNNQWFENNYYYDRENKINKDSLILAFKNKNTPVKSYYRALPAKNDYFEYATEILLEKMDMGNYLVFIETKNEIASETDAYTYGNITVSNLMAVEDTDTQNNLFYILDRKTGKPISDVTIKSEDDSAKTNNIGKASLKKQEHIPNKRYTNQLIISKGNDTIAQKYNREFIYKGSTEHEEDEMDRFQATAMVYFDRAIYRPGQKMYYKGILIQAKNKVKSVVPFASVHIKIQDVNDTTLKELDLQTNEFGSFSGEFDIPKNTLTGQFTITVDEADNIKMDKKYYVVEENEHLFWDNVDFNDSQFSFQVEEYKRPTFEVKFDEIKENYTIGDSIKIKGNAKALAGNNLTNAKVAYTVSKNTTRIGSYYNHETDDVVKEVFTDENGNFSIDFLAIENGVDNDSIERFNFYIRASVTDINGETRTANTSVNIGKKTLSLHVALKPKLFLEDENVLSINTTTLNNFPIDAKGEIKIYEKQQKSFLKYRLLGIPEIQTLSRTEFEQLFPYEPYDDTDTEIKKILVKTLPFDTKVNKKIALDFLKNFKKGNYEIITSATDSKNNLIVTENHFILASKKDTKSEKELFTYSDISKPNSNYFEIEVQSIIPDLYVTARLYENQKIETEQVLQLQKGKGIFKFLKKANYKEDINLHFSTIWENQSGVHTYSIPKETIEQKLNIEVISLRNKIEPGSLENWSFKILNQKLEAEVLASMYDMSLDQFAEKNWTDIFIDEDYKYPNYPDLNSNTVTNKYIYNFRQDNLYLPNYIQNTTLNWFGFDFNNPKSEYSRKKYLSKIQQKTVIPRSSKIITGIVTENGMPLPGVTIIVKGTTRGVQTDFDGYFEIEAAQDEVLDFSYIGFKPQFLVVDKRKNYEIMLEEDSQQLGEVVVVAYGTQKKQAVTGSITTLWSKSLEEEQNGSPLKAFVGTIAGISMITAGGQSGSNTTIQIRGASYDSEKNKPLFVVDGIPFEGDLMDINQSDILSLSVLKDATSATLYGSRGANGVVIITTKNALKELAQVKTRTNFNETAFFYPHIKTNADGQFSFNFTNPESLTRWKLRLYAHNKKAETGYFQSEIISQKDVMVQTNMPRFVREKDTITISAKVVNMTNEAKSGLAMLMLYDATNMKPIDSISLNTQNTRNFTCKPKESVPVNWTIAIPEELQGLQYKIVAKSGNFSDGEENIVPVLSNKILITESIPIWVKGNTKKEYTFENLKNNTSSTLKKHLFTLEYTSNPVWFALQSLPYLMQYEHECAEQIFSKYYGNFIATELINSNPKVASLFESWKNNPASTSKLNLNEELKSIVLNETPWLLDAENDELKNKRLALLMDLNMMKESMEKSFKKIAQRQLPSGAFSWFQGGNENPYITQHIVASFGHLGKMFPQKSAQFESIYKTAIPYLDNLYIKHSTLKNERIDYYAYSNLHYLYARSFYTEKMPISKKIDSIITVQKVEFKTNWLHYTLYKKALLALTMHRFGDREFAKKIISHLKETAARNEDNGMYWIENKNGYYWYQSSIETQAMLIEAFTEIEKDKTYADEMKVWLLKDKQANHWPTTKATTEAIYALLLQGNDWTNIKDNTKFKIGDEKVLTKKLASKDKEATTGYIKMNWKATEINNQMGNISVDNKSAVPGYGGVYWQYFENLENIKTDSTSTLSITKNLFKKEKSSSGEKLVELNAENIKTGDLITIRLIIKTENDLEFVHLKDLRASCFEPVDVLSGYQWSDRLSYYKSTKDVATHFFFDEIKAGTYVLEYDVRVNNAGHFSDGISTLQSMYAPEFSQHSKSSRVKVN